MNEQWKSPDNRPDPGKLGWNDRTDPGPSSQADRNFDEGLVKKVRETAYRDARNLYPLLHPETKDESIKDLAQRDTLKINQYDNDPPKWYEISSGFYSFMAAVLLIGAATLLTWVVTIDKARALDRASIKRQQESTATTLDLCSVRLPMMSGRMVKTEGEVLFWHRGEDGGLDLFLTREVANLREMCSMPVHLPPTVPETTWIPQCGERVAVCGLMVRSNNQARMNPGWRCL